MNRRALLVGGVAVAVVGGGVAMSIAGQGSGSEYAAAMARLRAPLDPSGGIDELVRFATLAANSHNTQPWHFTLADSVIRIAPDFSRRTPAVDPDDHHLYISLGCAAENLALAAAALGMPGTLRFDPGGDGAVVFEYARGKAVASPLVDAITRRQSAREDYDGRPVADADLALLTEASTVPGVAATLITERAKISAVRDLVVAANDAQMADAAFVRELKAWMRFNPRSALERGDGLYSASSGNPTLPTWLGAPTFDLAFTAAAENQRYVRQLDTSSGVVAFSGEVEDRASWVQVGRACQRFALQATALGMKTSFVNQPVEVQGFRTGLAELAGTPGRRPDILMRFGYGPDLPMSPRRPVAAVIEGRG